MPISSLFIFSQTMLIDLFLMRSTVLYSCSGASSTCRHFRNGARVQKRAEKTRKKAMKKSDQIGRATGNYHSRTCIFAVSAAVRARRRD